MTSRQKAMLRGPFFSLIFSVVYGIICGFATFVVLGMTFPDDETMFLSITSVFYIYATLTPGLTLYLMSIAENRQKKLSKNEEKERKLEMERERAREAKEQRRREREQQQQGNSTDEDIQGVPPQEVPLQEVPLNEVPLQEVPLQEESSQDIPSIIIHSENEPSEEITKEKVLNDKLSIPLDSVKCPSTKSLKVMKEIEALKVFAGKQSKSADFSPQNIPLDEIHSQVLSCPEIAVTETLSQEILAKEVPFIEIHSEMVPSDEIKHQKVSPESISIEENVLHLERCLSIKYLKALKEIKALKAFAGKQSKSADCLPQEIPFDENPSQVQSCPEIPMEANTSQEILTKKVPIIEIHSENEIKHQKVSPENIEENVLHLVRCLSIKSLKALKEIKDLKTFAGKQSKSAELLPQDIPLQDICSQFLSCPEIAIKAALSEEILAKENDPSEEFKHQELSSEKNSLEENVLHLERCPSVKSYKVLREIDQLRTSKETPFQEIHSQILSCQEIFPQTIPKREKSLGLFRCPCFKLYEIEEAIMDLHRTLTEKQHAKKYLLRKKYLESYV